MPLVFLLVFFVFMLSACSPREHVVSRQYFVMGTLATISLYTDADEESLDSVFQGALVLLQQQEKAWHPWQQGAELAALNATMAEKGRAEVPSSLAPLFRRARSLWKKTDGAFDPGLGALVRLWGFHDAEVLEHTEAPPAEADILALYERGVGLAQLNFMNTEHGLVIEGQKPGSDVVLDFGAMAKGEACDLVLDFLAKGGHGDALVNLGGNLKVQGSKGEKPWRIAIRHPDGGVLGALAVRGKTAIITSGDYERFFLYRGQRYHHVLDGRTGRPARGLRAATVMAESAALADAAATALMVAGPERWQKVAHDLGVARALVVDEVGVVWLTPEMDAQLVREDGFSYRVAGQR